MQNDLLLPLVWFDPEPWFDPGIQIGGAPAV
jgi:hypothetical protein